MTKKGLSHIQYLIRFAYQGNWPRGMYCWSCDVKIKVVGNQILVTVAITPEL